MDLWTIIAAVVTFLLSTVGGGWVGYVLKGAKVAKETGDFMTVFGKAVEDKQVTPEEIASVLKEYNEMKEAWEALRNMKQKQAG